MQKLLYPKSIFSKLTLVTFSKGSRSCIDSFKLSLLSFTKRIFNIGM